MTPADTHTSGKTPAGGRIDSVRPPASLPDGTPLERMTELTRRLLAVPKDEAIPPKKRRKRKHG